MLLIFVGALWYIDYGNRACSCFFYHELILTNETLSFILRLVLWIQRSPLNAQCDFLKHNTKTKKDFIYSHIFTRDRFGNPRNFADCVSCNITTFSLLVNNRYSSSLSLDGTLENKNNSAQRDMCEEEKERVRKEEQEKDHVTEGKDPIYIKHVMFSKLSISFNGTNLSLIYRIEMRTSTNRPCRGPFFVELERAFISSCLEHSVTTPDPVLFNGLQLVKANVQTYSFHAVCCKKSDAKYVCERNTVKMNKREKLALSRVHESIRHANLRGYCDEKRLVMRNNTTFNQRLFNVYSIFPKYITKEIKNFSDGIYDARRFNFQFLPADAQPTSSTSITPFLEQGLYGADGRGEGVLAYPLLEKKKRITRAHTNRLMFLWGYVDRCPSLLYDVYDLFISTLPLKPSIGKQRKQSCTYL
ncbi:hypothetical protein ALC53_08789 [Atta colombica]|uniref:Uncharacterized protein n=1 Tax=Atta colombica TaxID=520822 RepID=A0A195B8C8_9HYME|nr:hypothetical protein ALC53_08789 [Atta colombica]